MLFLKQSTAVTVKIGPFLDSTDGNTAETALTLSQADIRLSKNGANIAQKGESSAATHDELGYYDCDLNTTDTGTLGRLRLMVHESGALPVWHEFMVLPANIYDSLVAGSDNLEVDSVALSGDSTAADNAEAFFDGTGYAGTNNVIPTVTTLTGHTAQTGDNFARIGAAGASLSAIPWNASWDAEVQSEVTDGLNAYDPPTKAELDSGLAALNDLTAAEVNAEVDSALADIHLDHLLAATYDPASKPGAADALLNELIENDGGVSRYTANALEEGAGTGATAAEVRTEMDSNSTQLAAIVGDTNELQADWTNGGRLDLIIDAILADTAELQADDVPGLIAALNDPTAAAIADAVCDEALAGHQTNGTVGKQLTDVALSDELPSSPPSAASIRAEIDSNSTQLAAIVTDTAALNDTALPDSVPADGSIPTLKQAVYMINQFLMERSIADTTVTVNKVDGSTSLLTLTLSDGTSPTSITRAT